MSTFVERRQTDRWVSLTQPGIYQSMVLGMMAQLYGSVSGSMAPVDAQAPIETMAADEKQRRKNEATKQLIQQWLGDDSGYDEEAWPVLKETCDSCISPP